MGKRRWAAALVAAGMTLSLSACASTDENQTDGSGDNAAASLTQANFSQILTAAQAEVQSAHMDATVDMGGQSGSISGDFTGFADIDSLSMDMQVDVAGQQIEMRLVDKVLYVNAAAISGNKGKPWVKIDLNDPGNPLSRIMDTANPKNFTVYLQAVKTLDDRGMETVDGVEAHHYTVTIDTAKAMAANPALKGQDTSKLGLPGQITTDVWLNGDNLPVKMSVPLGDAGSFEAHFSKYDEQVSVVAPPANQISDLTHFGD